MIMRKGSLLGVMVMSLLLVVGCDSKPQETNVSADQLKANFGPDVKIAYGNKILDLLDAFDRAAKNAEYTDDKTLDHYIATKELPKSLLNRLNQGVAREMKILQDIDALHPPEAFLAFHQQVEKNLQQRIDHLSGLILAIEKGDKREIQKVLNEALEDGKQRREEMDKILQGKTAEEYLGIK